MPKVLFICSRNQLRSPTVEAVFAALPGIETDSPGLADDAARPLDADQLAWADLIYVMEKRHRALLTRRFKHHLKGKKLVCLDIPDHYSYMQPELVQLLQQRVPRHLGL